MGDMRRRTLTLQWESASDPALPWCSVGCRRRLWLTTIISKCQTRSTYLTRSIDLGFSS